MIALQDTRILITVQLIDDSATDLMTFFFFVTSLFAVVARLGRFVSYLNGWIDDITEAVSFTVKVFDIAFKSLAYGLGVTV
jgi:hypothetical protein